MLLHRSMLCLVLLICSARAYGESWDMLAGYSTTSNPIGSWSYGRRWSTAGDGFDLMTFRWLVGNGWYMGNWGHGGPSLADPMQLWAKDNSNGFPVVRWTSPADGYYDVDFTFTGADGRGVGNNVFVVVGGTVRFSDSVNANLASASGSLPGLYVAQGDYVDFLLSWNGSVYSEYGWTRLSGGVQTAIPEPALCVPLGCLVPLLLKRAAERPRRNRR